MQEKGKGTLSGGRKKDEAYHTEQRKRARIIGMQSCRYPSTNRELSQNDGFQTLCGAADVKPTARQASKFRRGFGKAYAAKKALN